MVKAEIPKKGWENTMLNVQNLHKSYQVGKTTYEVLKGVSFQVAKGEFVAVMGPSGSGKTTLLNCISCYIPADSGQITLGQRQLAKLDEPALAAVRNKQLGFVFQDFLLLDGLTVRQNILLPAIIGGTVGRTVEEGNLDSKSSRAVIASFEQARDALQATIFMVTHDSFAASFCDRVIILQDGVVWQVLAKGEQDRTRFQDQLLDAIRDMGKE